MAGLLLSMGSSVMRPNRKPKLETSSIWNMAGTASFSLCCTSCIAQTCSKGIAQTCSKAIAQTCSKAVADTSLCSTGKTALPWAPLFCSSTCWQSSRAGVCHCIVISGHKIWTSCSTVVLLQIVGSQLAPRTWNIQWYWLIESKTACADAHCKSGSCLFCSRAVFVQWLWSFPFMS